MPLELYTRQQQLNLSIPRGGVTIAGVGGVGFWVATYCAMSGIPNLYLFDPDVLEESNRNRLPVCEGSIGRPKVEVAKEFILPLRPNIIIVAVQEKLEELFLNIQLRVSDWVIDCTDSPKAQHTLYNACLKAHKGYIRAGYDGTHMTVTSNVSGWIKKDVEEEQYEINPSWVVPSATVAALAVAKLMKYPQQEVGLDLSEIGVPAVQRYKRLSKRCRQEGDSPLVRSRVAQMERDREVARERRVRRVNIRI